MMLRLNEKLEPMRVTSVPIARMIVGLNGVEHRFDPALELWLFRPQLKDDVNEKK